MISWCYGNLKVLGRKKSNDKVIYKSSDKYTFFYEWVHAFRRQIWVGIIIINGSLCQRFLPNTMHEEATILFQRYAKPFFFFLCIVLWVYYVRKNTLVFKLTNYWTFLPEIHVHTHPTTECHNTTISVRKEIQVTVHILEPPFPTHPCIHTI